MAPIISVKDLTHIYSAGTPFEHVAIQNINFSANAGELIGVIGHTGSGKSTMIQHLNGLLKPTSGKVLFQGEDIWKEYCFSNVSIVSSIIGVKNGVFFVEYHHFHRRRTDVDTYL